MSHCKSWLEINSFHSLAPRNQRSTLPCISCYSEVVFFLSLEIVTGHIEGTAAACCGGLCLTIGINQSNQKAPQPMAWALTAAGS